MYITNIDKKEAVIIFKKSNLDNKGVLQMKFNPNISPIDVMKKVHLEEHILEIINFIKIHGKN